MKKHTKSSYAGSVTVMRMVQQRILQLLLHIISIAPCPWTPCGPECGFFPL